MKIEKTGIQLFSDIHGEVEVFDKIDRTRGIIFLGDIFDRGNNQLLAVKKMYELKKEQGDKFAIVLGNHDEWLYVTLGVKLSTPEERINCALLAILNGFVDTFTQLFGLNEKEREILQLLTDDFYIGNFSPLFEEISRFVLIDRNNIMDKLYYLCGVSRDCCVAKFDIGDKTEYIKLSHSGEEDTFANFYTSTSKLPNTWHLHIMGHWKIDYTNDVYYYFSKHIKKDESEFKLIRRRKTTQLFALINGATDNLVELDDILEEFFG